MLKHQKVSKYHESGCSLVFTATFFNYHQSVSNAINIGVSDPKTPRGLQMVHPSENAFFKFHDLFLYSSLYKPSLIQKTLLESKLLSQGSIEQKHLSKNVKNFESNKKIGFSTESVKKPTIYDLLFIIAIYFLQNVNKYPSEMKN